MAAAGLDISIRLDTLPAQAYLRRLLGGCPRIGISKSALTCEYCFLEIAKSLGESAFSDNFLMLRPEFRY